MARGAGSVAPAGDIKTFLELEARWKERRKGEMEREEKVRAQGFAQGQQSEKAAKEAVIFLVLALFAILVFGFVVFAMWMTA